MCAKSVAVTWLCAHCFDKNFVFSVFFCVFFFSITFYALAKDSQ